MTGKLAVIFLLAGCLNAPAALSQQAAGASGTHVYIFLSASCPMCQNYAPVLNEMYEKYHASGISFTGVFPNFYTTDSIIQEFTRKYKVQYPVIKDEGLAFTDKFAATVTPQVFVVNENSGIVLYSGMINNGYLRPGKRRNVVTEHYLRDALDAVITGNPISIPFVQPVGCFIVKN